MFPSTIAALLYVATIRFEFVYDDVSQIVLNPFVHTWKAFPLLFTTDVWRFQNPLIVGSFWRPIFSLWLLINYALFGTNSIGWHATTVAIYSLSTYTVYRLVLRLGADPWLATFAALIFAVHPAHLESAAWVSGVTDSLLSIFLFISLLCFIRGTARNNTDSLWIALSVVFYALAILTKETAIVEPVLVATYVFLFSSEIRRVRKAAILTFPFLVLTALYLIARHSVLHEFSHVYLPISSRDALVALPSLIYFYGKHLLWPVGLSVIYDASPITNLQWTNFWGPAVTILLVVICGAAYLWRSRDRISAFAFVLLVVPLLPALNIRVLEPGNFLHDRYLFLPSAGFALLIARQIRRLRFGESRVFGISGIQVALMATLMLAGAYATASQQIYWANDVLLFSRATTVAPANETAFNNLGTALAAHGRKNEAILAFQQVIKRNPHAWRALYNLGLGNFMDGRYKEAEFYLRRAVEANTLEGDPSALLAEALIRQGRYSEAEGAIEYALKVMPYKPGYRRVLALSLEGQGRLPEAIRAARSEQQNHPNNEETQKLLERLEGEARATDRFSRGK
ncbi:MAG TPA: tetratricopeptide repeat protein [Terriglobales bacterium]|nr:tetratricopeptide repeat protein [Terriglobales bacterium]